MSTSGSGEMDITSWDVLEELECPVCMEYMTSPIPMCTNGHNICNTCKPKVDHCALCREQLSESRCWLLENIIEKIKFRCQYYTEGCEFITTAQFIKSHEAGCPDRPFDCPFSVVGTKNFCWKDTEVVCGATFWTSTDHLLYHENVNSSLHWTVLHLVHCT